MRLAIIGRSFVEPGEETTVELARAEGGSVVLRSHDPAAPGTRLEVRIPDGQAARLKVHRCIRREDHFELHAGVIDAPSSVRRALLDATRTSTTEAED